MPCHRCGARQSDPIRGPSTWKRGVVGGAHVLVCPTCQRDPDWTSDLDRCPDCGSTMLVRRLGETVCRACGAFVAEPVSRSRPENQTSPSQTSPSPAAGNALTREVGEAVERVLGRRPPAPPKPPAATSQ